MESLEASFEVLSEYLRSGRYPRLNVQNTIDLYSTSSGLGITELSKKCWQFACEQDNGVQLLLLYVELGVKNDLLMQEVAKRFRDVYTSIAFVQLSAKQMKTLMSNSHIKNVEAKRRYEATMMWLHTDCRQRLGHAKQLLANVENFKHFESRTNIPMCPMIFREIYGSASVRKKSVPSTTASEENRIEPPAENQGEKIENKNPITKKSNPKKENKRISKIKSSFKMKFRSKSKKASKNAGTQANTNDDPKKPE